MSLSTNELSLLSDAIVSTLDANNVKFSLYSNYSGRSMYGDTCLGFVVDSKGDCNSLLVNITHQITSQFTDGQMDDDRMVDSPIMDLMQYLSNAKIDNMGRGFIVYFPQIKFDEFSEDQKQYLLSAFDDN
jgi:hypothetical protein